MERVNTDEIVRSFGNWRNPSDVMKAGKMAVNRIRDYFDNGVSFNQETTLCGNSILKNIDRAKLLEYEIELHYVGVDSVELAKQRIKYRVAHGGHGIPDCDVERRYVESFEQLNVLKSKCDLVVFYDNSEKFNRFAIYKNGILCKISNEVPMWYKKYIK